MSKPDNKSLEKSIRNLAQILTETGLTEIEVDYGDYHIRVARDGTPSTGSAPSPPRVPVQQPAAALTENKHENQSNIDPKIAEGTITSPMVGTVYLAPEPGADPFVHIGDQVKKGQTILIIEAMKTMNHISATQEGVVKDILVDDTQAVEFGQPLIVVQ